MPAGRARERFAAGDRSVPETSSNSPVSLAARIHGARDLRTEAHVPSSAGEDEVDVEIASVGICGSDLHYYKDGGIGGAIIAAPFVPGHEFSARLTRDVESRGLRRGELVAIDPATPCHRCEWCRAGHHNLCPSVVFLGAPPHDGALTTRMAVPEASLIALPEGMSADEGAMLEPLGVCIHAMDLARPAPWDSVALVGCGPIGLGVLQLLALAGVDEIVAVDPQPHRTALALSIGASAAGDSVEAVGEATGGRGCDIVIEATNSPEGFAHAVRAAAIGARVVLVGIPDGDLYTAMPAAEARRRGLTVRFSRRMGEVYPRAVALVAGGRIDVMRLVTHRFALEEVPAAYEMHARGEPGLVKSLVHPNGKPDS